MRILYGAGGMGCSDASGANLTAAYVRAPVYNVEQAQSASILGKGSAVTDLGPPGRHTGLTSRLLGKGAELMTLRGMMFGAIFGACYGLLVVPSTMLLRMLSAGQNDQGQTFYSLVLTMLIALLGTILGAIYGTVLGAISGVLTGLVLGAVTRTRFMTLRDLRRYRLEMRALAVGCAAVLLGTVFAFMPLIPFQDLHSLGGWLVETGGPALAGCATAWCAGGQFAGWYIGEWIQADSIRCIMAAHPYPLPYPHPPLYEGPFANFPMPYPPPYPAPVPPPAPPAGPPPAP